MNIYDNQDDSYKPKNDEEEFMYFINVDESDDDASRKQGGIIFFTSWEPSISADYLARNRVIRDYY